MAALLAEAGQGVLCVSGCVSNQCRFYPQFGVVVLLSVPAEVLLGRLTARTANDYGKSAE